MNFYHYLPYGAALTKRCSASPSQPAPVSQLVAKQTQASQARYSIGEVTYKMQEGNSKVIVADDGVTQTAPSVGLFSNEILSSAH